MQDRTEHGYDVLVDQVAVHILRTDRHNASLAHEVPQSLERCELYRLEVLQSEKLDQDGYDGALEQRVDALSLGKEDLAQLTCALEELLNQVLQIWQDVRSTQIAQEVQGKRGQTGVLAYVKVGVWNAPFLDHVTQDLEPNFQMITLHGIL